MLRQCLGEDPNLLMILGTDGQRVERSTSATKTAPCDCGLLFDDARRQVIWPHPEL